MLFEEKKKLLISWLQKAMELEISTIPPYMVALLSIKRGSNKSAMANIHSVMMEEMLHMVLIANVMSSIGGRISIGENNIPSYPLEFNFQGKTFKDRKFRVNLAPFSAATIDIFMQIEQPSDIAETFKAKDAIDVPGLTIGEFYQGIITLIEELVVNHNEKLFVGDPAKQISPEYYWGGGGGKPVIVTDLSSAKEALNIVINQGEGAPTIASDALVANAGETFKLGHYYRFKEIIFGRKYSSGDKHTDPPSGEAFTVDYAAVYPIKINPKGTDYQSGSVLANLNNRFNQQYSIMLTQLEEALNGNPKILHTAIMNGMQGINQLAIQMMNTPIEGEPEGRHGCPSFEWIEM